MFSAIILVQAGAVVAPVPGGTGAAGQFDTAAAAKKAAEAYITANKASYNNGYEIYLVDRDSHSLVSVAFTAPPTLSWQDQAAPAAAAGR